MCCRPRRHERPGPGRLGEQRLLPLRGLPPEQQAERVAAAGTSWTAPGERFLLTKLIGGGFRVGVSKLLVQRALARHAGLDAKLVAQRMMGWTDGRQARPRPRAFQALVAPAEKARWPPADSGQPYPFFLAHALDGAPDQRPPGWARWPTGRSSGSTTASAPSWCGAAGQVWIWSRGEELMTDRFPEVVALATGLPDGTVLDGEILVWGRRPAGAFQGCCSSASAARP
jgi:DNA ligase-1